MHWVNGLTQHTPETVRLHKQPRQMTERTCFRRRAQLDAELNNFIFSNSKPGVGGGIRWVGIIKRIVFASENFISINNRVR